MNTTFEELTRALVAWFERELGILLHHVAPGTDSTILGTYYGEHAGKLLTVAVSSAGEPQLDGELAALADPSAAVAAYRAAQESEQTAQADAAQPRRPRRGISAEAK